MTRPDDERDHIGTGAGLGAAVVLTAVLLGAGLGALVTWWLM